MGNSNKSKPKTIQTVSIPHQSTSHPTHHSTAQVQEIHNPHENTIGLQNLIEEEIKFSHSRPILAHYNPNNLIQDNANINITRQDNNLLHYNVTNIIQDNGNADNTRQGNANNITQVNGSVEITAQDNNNVNNIVQEDGIFENTTQDNNIVQVNMNIKSKFTDPERFENNDPFTTNELDINLVEDNLNQSSKILDLEKFLSVDVTTTSDNSLNDSYHNITLPYKEKGKISFMKLDHKIENDKRDSLDIIVDEFCFKDEEFLTLKGQTEKSDIFNGIKTKSILTEKALSDKEKENALSNFHKRQFLKIFSNEKQKNPAIHQVAMNQNNVNPQKQDKLKEEREISRTDQVAINQNINPQKKDKLKDKKTKISETHQNSLNQNINPEKKNELKVEKKEISSSLKSDDKFSNLILKHIEDVDKCLKNYISQKPKLTNEIMKQITTLNDKINKVLNDQNLPNSSLESLPSTSQSGNTTAKSNDQNSCQVRDRNSKRQPLDSNEAIEANHLTNASDSIGKTSLGQERSNFAFINKNNESIEEKFTKKTYDPKDIQIIWKKNKGYFPYVMFENNAWLCYLCEVILTAEMNALEHVSGKKHNQRLEKTFEKLGKELEKGIVRTNIEKMYCIPCKQNINCKSDLLLHIILKSHRTNLIQFSLNNLKKINCIDICKKHKFIGLNETLLGEYYCELCNKPLPNEQQIVNHILCSEHRTEVWEDHSSEYLCVINEFNSYRCVPCDLSFLYIEQIRDHFKIDHTQHINFLKKYIQDSKGQSNDVEIKKSQGAIPKLKNQEKEEVSNINNLQNPQVNEKFKNIIDWNRMQTINNLEFSISKSKTYYCVPCDLGPFDKITWNQHSHGKLHKKKVKNLQLNVEEFVCQFCKNFVCTYSDILGMNSHYENVHNTKVFFEKNNLISSYST